MRVFSNLEPRSNKNKSCMRVDESFLKSWAPVKQEQELHESRWEFSQILSPRQTRTRVAWELRSESLHESFLNSRAPVKQEQELHESWWELRSESLHESFLNSWAPVKREQELHESRWELRGGGGGGGGGAVTSQWIVATSFDRGFTLGSSSVQ
jgi:hypothetical protein